MHLWDLLATCSEYRLTLDQLNLVQRHRQSEVTGMMPFYATKPLKASDQSLGYLEISICETPRNETFGFINLKGLKLLSNSQGFRI